MKDLITALVLLTKGTQEEKIKCMNRTVAGNMK